MKLGKRTLLLTASAVAIIAGAVTMMMFHNTAQTRLSTGIPVTGTITAKEPALWLVTKHIKVLKAEYEAGGQTYTATLGESAFGSLSAEYTGLQSGDTVTLYLDPLNPHNAAIRGGLISEGRWTMLPWLLWVTGLCLILAIRLVKPARKQQSRPGNEAGDGRSINADPT
jgi:hypothetical protein